MTTIALFGQSPRRTDTDIFVQSVVMLEPVMGQSPRYLASLCTMAEHLPTFFLNCPFLTIGSCKQSSNLSRTQKHFDGIWS